MGNRDHGGGLDAALLTYGGDRSDWLDLSTGINPQPYPTPALPQHAWTALPDSNAMDGLLRAARAFWAVPAEAELVAASGASALIAAIPGLKPASTVQITRPTYNEHAAAFAEWGWTESTTAAARVIVHPNNPDGRFWTDQDIGRDLTVIDESFCDPTPDRSLIEQTLKPGVIVLKSFGKFWGLAGIRLGFAICLPDLAHSLRDRIGPWSVSGPGLHIGALALRDQDWAARTRARLEKDSARMDRMLTDAGFVVQGGTTLFRLVATSNAQKVKEALAQSHILVRTFPYSDKLVRFGLPGTDRDWSRLGVALS